MATGGRKSQLQCIHQISILLGPNTPVAGNIGVLPAGALLLTAHLSVGTVFNSTTNTVSAGIGAGGTQLLNAISLTAAARTDTPAPVANQGPLTADTPITYTLASTGAAPTQGAAVLAVDYIAAVG